MLLQNKNAVSRILAGELGPSGIRVICLRPDAIPEAVVTSHAREVFSGFAERAGTIGSNRTLIYSDFTTRYLRDHLHSISTFRMSSADTDARRLTRGSNQSLPTRNSDDVHLPHTIRSASIVRSRLRVIAPGISGAPPTRRDT